MYLEHFGLREMPFSLAPDPRYLYLSAQHREALAHLLYGVQSEGGFVQLTGEVGTGKTTVCRAFLEQLPPGARAAVILNPGLGADELLEAICDEFEIPRAGAAAGLKESLDRLNAHLLEVHAAGGRAVLVIDEAQNLGAPVLERLRLLTNLETSRHKLLQIVLMGQPELRTTLARPELRQLAQRVTARFHLPPLSRAETAAYVRHRLAVAGGDARLFPDDVLGALHRRSRGVPRLVNILCDRALLGAFVQGKHAVDRATLAQAGREVAGETGSGALPWRAAAVTAAAVALAALLLGGLWRWGGGGTPDRPPPPAPAPPRAASRAPASAPVAAPASATAAAPAPSPAPAGAPTPARVSATVPAAAVPPPAPKPEPAPEPVRRETVAPAPAAVSPPAPVPVPSQAVAPAPAAPLPPPAAVPAAAPVAPAAPRAPVSGVLRALMDQPEAQREDEAWRWLFRLWGIRAREGENGCSQALAHGLDCLRGEGGLERLRLLNRPAVVRAWDPQGAPRWLVLERIQGRQVTFCAGGARTVVDAARLEGYRIDQFALLWRRPADTGGALAAGDAGPGVAWLARRLDAVSGGPPGAAPERFDEALAARVREFQRAIGMDADGVAGPAVLLALDAAPEPGTPTLAGDGGGP